MGFFCTYCGEMFSKEDQLNQHVHIHTELKPFKCITCHLAFKRRDLLQRHYLLIHDTTDQASLPRRPSSIERRPIACTLCAKAKTKCDKALPTCGRCASKGLVCEARVARQLSHKAAKQSLNQHRKSSLKRQRTNTFPRTGFGTTRDEVGNKTPERIISAPDDGFTSSPQALQRSLTAPSQASSYVGDEINNQTTIQVEQPSWTAMRSSSIVEIFPEYSENASPNYFESQNTMCRESCGQDPGAESRAAAPSPNPGFSASSACRSVDARSDPSPQNCNYQVDDTTWPAGTLAVSTPVGSRTSSFSYSPAISSSSLVAPNTPPEAQHFPLAASGFPYGSSLPGHCSEGLFQLQSTYSHAWPTDAGVYAFQDATMEQKPAEFAVVPCENVTQLQPQYSFVQPPANFWLDEHESPGIAISHGQWW